MAEAQDLTLRRAFVALRRRWWLVLACTLLAGGTAFGLSKVQNEAFTAESTLLFRDPGFDQRLFGASVFQSLDPDRAAATNVGLASLDAVAERTATEEEFDGLSGSDISSRVEVSAEGQADLVSVSATDPEPAQAAALANAFAENYIAFRRDADRAKISEALSLLEEELESAETRAETASLQDQISQLRTLEALQTGNAELVQEAAVPTSPSAPQTTRNTVLGLLFGFLIGALLAVLMERFDRRLRTLNEIEEIYELPVLATTPISEQLSIGASTDLEFAERESFRTLRTRLRYFNVDRDLQAVLVTSAIPGEGKSTTAWHLARSSAAAGRPTALLEADLHAPTVAASAGLAPLPGLAELLTHQNEFEDVVQTVLVPESQGTKLDPTSERELDVIVAGANPPNPLELLESQELSLLFERLRSQYELIVIDTPPINVLSDAIPIMKRVDGVVIVASIAHTTRDAAERLHQECVRLGAPTLGVVANRVPRASNAYGYGYARYEAPVERVG